MTTLDALVAALYGHNPALDTLWNGRNLVTSFRAEVDGALLRVTLVVQDKQPGLLVEVQTPEQREEVSTRDVSEAGLKAAIEQLRTRLKRPDLAGVDCPADR